MEWFTLARVVADHAGWQEERAQVESWLRHATTRTGEAYDQVIFAPWFRTGSGVVCYQFETCSRRVLEEFLELRVGNDW